MENDAVQSSSSSSSVVVEDNNTTSAATNSSDATTTTTTAVVVSEAEAAASAAASAASASAASDNLESTASADITTDANATTPTPAVASAAAATPPPTAEKKSGKKRDAANASVPSPRAAKTAVVKARKSPAPTIKAPKTTMSSTYPSARSPRSPRSAPTSPRMCSSTSEGSASSGVCRPTALSAMREMQAKELRDRLKQQTEDKHSWAATGKIDQNKLYNFKDIFTPDQVKPLSATLKPTSTGKAAPSASPVWKPNSTCKNFSVADASSPIRILCPPSPRAKQLSSTYRGADNMLEFTKINEITPSNLAATSTHTPTHAAATPGSAAHVVVTPLPLATVMAHTGRAIIDDKSFTANKIHRDAFPWLCTSDEKVKAN